MRAASQALVMGSEMRERFNGAIVTRAEAIERGLKRFFTGIPCRNGHIAERYVTWGCVECGLIQGARYRAAHRKEPRPLLDPKMRQQRARATTAKWRTDHPERVRQLAREAARRWRAAHPEDAKETERKSREKHGEKRREAGRLLKRQIRASDPEKARVALREWARRNPDKVGASNRRARALRSGLISAGKFTVDDERDLFKKQKGRCAWCSEKLGKRYHVDHIMPLVKGGVHDKANIQLLHALCNMRKHDKDPFIFAQENGRLL